VKVVLVMFTPEGERRDVPVKHDKVVLGRESGCDIRIPIAAVSRKHCQIEVKDDELLVSDLGSRNGTYRNEAKVDDPVALFAGDRLAVGPVVFTVQIDGDPEPVEPPLLESPMVAAQGDSPTDAGDNPSGDSASKKQGGGESDSAAGISDLLADLEGSSEFDFDLDDLEED